MSVDKLFGGGPKIPDLPAVPTRQDPQVQSAQRQTKRRTQSISRRTVLGGRTGSAESVARKTLLGE